MSRPRLRRRCAAAGRGVCTSAGRLRAGQPAGRRRSRRKRLRASAALASAKASAAAVAALIAPSGQPPSRSARVKIVRNGTRASSSAPGPLRRPEQQPGQARSGQGQQEGQQRGTADRGPARGRRTGLAHRQPAPRKGVRPPVPHCLGAHPPARHRCRPGPQPQQQALAHGEHGETPPSRRPRGPPRRTGDIDKPGNQRNENRRAEHQPDQAFPQAPAPRYSMSSVR